RQSRTGRHDRADGARDVRNGHGARAASVAAAHQDRRAMTREKERLLEAGIRPTRQRVAIVGAVSRERRPVTAQDLHRHLNARRGGPGLATVYRTLGALAEAGVLTTFPAGEGELAYRLCE